MRSPPDMRHLALKRKYFRKNLTIFEMFANCQIVCTVTFAHTTTMFGENFTETRITIGIVPSLAPPPSCCLHFPEGWCRFQRFREEKMNTTLVPPRIDIGFRSRHHEGGGGVEGGGGWIHKNDSSSTLTIPLLPQF